MGIRSYFGRLFATAMEPLIEAEVQKRLPAAAASDTTDAEEGWRRLTGQSLRELPIATHGRMIEIAYWLWRTNPLANWIIEITTAFVAGDGFTLSAKNEQVQEVLTEFWDHPINNLPLYLEKHTRELGIYGSLLFPKFVSPYSGKVALGYVDLALIKTVVTDPQNVKVIIGIITRGVDFQDGRRYKTVLAPEAEEFLSPAAQEWRANCPAECYYFAINNVTNDPYGCSDLFPIADWLDQYEQFLFDLSDKWLLLNAFVWDLIVEGATAEQIEEEVKRFTKKSGSVYGHNEKIKLEAVSPDLKTFDASEGARMFRNHILGSAGLPEHWYGGGGDVNRAAASEMGAPTFRKLSARQKFVIYIWTYILDDVLREAEAHGMLKVPDDEKGYSLNTPELASKDLSKFSTAIQQLCTSLVAAETSNWITRDEAVKVFAFALSLIGYEIDVEAITASLDEEEEKRGYEDGKQPATGGAPPVGPGGSAA